MKSPILFENESFLIVNKREGLSVHNPLPGEPCLLDELPTGCHLVHRLDKETSGVILVAKNSSIASELMGILETKKVQKVYSAVLRGKIPPSDGWQQWKWPLTDKGEGRKNPQGMAKDRKEALTMWQCKASTDYLALVDAQIITGRQHQIRKHSALAGHPIVGDPRYNDQKYNAKMAQIYKTERMFLHARLLNFEWKQQNWSFTADLPVEFLQAVPIEQKIV